MNTIKKNRWQLSEVVCPGGMTMAEGAPVGLTAHRPSVRLATVFLLSLI
ncbi:MAG: hypothetical protein ACP5D9_12605 [Mariniphaga sp.]